MTPTRGARRALLVTLLLGLLASVSTPALAGPAAGAADFQPSFLHELELESESGERFDVASVGGNATLVGIWATWCPSCRTELPKLLALEAEYRNRGIKLLLVGVDRQAAKGAGYLDNLRYQGLRAYDPGAAGIMRAGIEGIPTVVVLDERGNVFGKVTGSGDAALLAIRTHVTDILATRTPTLLGDGHAD